MSATSKDGGGFPRHPEDYIELHTLTRQGRDPLLDGREERHRLKSERKLRELDEREAMKFSHSVQFNAVPDWSSNYISYSNLKKL